MTTALGLGARVLCVFVLLALVLWVLKRTDGLGARRRSTPVQVLTTTRLGKAATLSVVRVHDEEHVLAVTSAGITVVSSRPAADADVVPAGPQTAATAPAPTPAPPTAAAFLRAGWQVLRQQPVASTELADDEVAAALTRACSPAPAAEGFAADLAAALEAVEPPPTAEPVVVAVPAPRSPGDLAPGHAPHRRRREVRPPHLRAPRRGLRTVEEGTA